MKSKLKKVFITFVTFLILTSICSINTNPEQIRKEIDDINNKIEKLENEKGGINILKNYRIPLKDAQIAKLQYEEFMIEQKFWMGGFFQFWSNLINSKYIGRAIVLTVILFLVPVAIKILLFFICSPRLSKVNTQIFKPSNSSGEANIVQSGRSISVNIPDDGIFVKDETYVNGTEGAVQLNRTIFKKSQTKMSFMLKLKTMLFIEYSGASKLVITSKNLEENFIEIDIKNMPLYVIPSSIVAYSGKLKFESHWRFSNPFGLAIGQIRYYTVSGEGKLIISGQGELLPINTPPEATLNFYQNMLLCSLTQDVFIRRSANLVPYILGKANLFEFQVKNSGFFVKARGRGGATQTENSVNFIFSTIGSFFGF